MNTNAELLDLIGHSDDICADCLSLGYIGCLEPVSLDSPSSGPEPFLGKDSPVDLLTLESTKPVDEHSKFQGWGDWETLMNEPLHSAILSGEIDRRRRRTVDDDDDDDDDDEVVECPRYKEGYATISEYTLSGKSSFRRRCLSQLTNIQAFHFQLT